MHRVTLADVSAARAVVAVNRGCLRLRGPIAGLFVVTSFLLNQPVHAAETSTASATSETLTKEQCKEFLRAPDACPTGLTEAQCTLRRGPEIQKAIREKCLADYPDLGPSWSQWRKALLEDPRVRDALGLLVLAVLGLATAGVGYLRGQIGLLRKRLNDPFVKRPQKYEQRAVNLVLVGEGGSGKTTLLRALTGSDAIRPDVGTDEIVTYTLVNELTVQKKDGEPVRQLTRVYVEDYVGQKWTQIANNDRLRVRQQRIEATTIVIIVDLFAPGSQTSPTEPASKFDGRRIKQQLGFYNEGIRQTLVDMLGKGSRQIILFINKYDLLHPPMLEGSIEAAEEYRSLMSALEDETRGVKLRTIVGSAATGQGVVGYEDGSDDRKSLLKAVLDQSVVMNEA